MSHRWSKTPLPTVTGLAASVHAATCMDPYLRWAVATRWRAFILKGRWSAQGSEPGQVAGQVQLLMRASSSRVFDALHEKRNEIGLSIDMDVYGGCIPGTECRAKHFTARIRSDRLASLIGLNLKGLKWELALPLREADGPTASLASGRYGITRELTTFAAKNVLAPSLRQVKQRGAAVTASQSAVRSRLGTIAVIDSGCPFLHERFLMPAAKGGHGRLVAIWDQGRPARTRQISASSKRGWPWRTPRHFSYGREMQAAAIQAMVNGIRPGGAVYSVDESDAYRGIDHLIDYRDARRRIWHATHGGHVLDVAGGTFDPLTGATDEASEADLAFVQLPSLTAADASGGSLGAHLLDAVRWVFSITQPDEPLVINVSYGSHAGSHDGKSLIETALDELLEQRARNFAIVVAAGNAGQADSHVQRRVEIGKSAVLRAHLAEGDTTDTFIEAWYDPPTSGSLRARVRTPAGVWSDWVEPGAQQELRDDASYEVMAMLRHDLKVPNGGRALLLLAVAPTSQPQDQAMTPAPAGRWEIEVDLVASGGGHPAASDPVVVDAWLERDDPGRGGVMQDLHRFVGLDRDDDENTLSSLASGAHTVVVGGCWRSNGLPVPYSSRGPRDTSRAGVLPMVWAPSDESPEQPGILAAATRSTDAFRMSGTSVAAPVVARRLFNLMVRKGGLDRGRMKEHLDTMCKEFGDVVRKA